jgi:hypothetical protein
MKNVHVTEEEICEGLVQRCYRGWVYGMLRGVEIVVWLVLCGFVG